MAFDETEIAEAELEEGETAKEETSEDETTEADEKREMLWHYASLIAAAAAVIAFGFLIGRFVVPVSEDAVTKKTSALFETDKDYLSAIKDGENINGEIDSLNADSDRI